MLVFQLIWLTGAGFYVMFSFMNSIRYNVPNRTLYNIGEALIWPLMAIYIFGKAYSDSHNKKILSGDDHELT